MDVQPVGAGPPGADLPHAPGRDDGSAHARGTPQLAAQVDAAALEGLATADLDMLAALLEPPQSPAAALRADQLLEQAVAAVVNGNAPAAMAALTELAALDPRRVEDLRSTPGLEPIRSQVEQLVQHMATLAHLDAEGRLSNAAELLEGLGTGGRLPGWESRPDVLLAAAQRLYDTGGQANYIRAAELAQAFLAAGQWAPAEASTPARRVGVSLSEPDEAEEEPDGEPPLLWRLWQRAPLLLLLLGWAAAGLVGGLAAWVGLLGPVAGDFLFTIWGTGFLTLVLFGLFARVRRARW